VLVSVVYSNGEEWIDIVSRIARAERRALKRIANKG
jgi:hypothetical protein